MEKIENLIIAVSRYFLIIFGALSLIGALVLLVYSLVLISDKPSKNYNQGETSFLDIEQLIFPSQLNTTRQETIDEGLIDSDDQNLQPVDEIYFQIRKSISLHFNDSDENSKKFNTRITPRSLSSYIEINYLTYLDFNNKNAAKNNLANFFKSIEKRLEYKRVGDFDSRIELITETIDLVFEDFYARLDAKEDELNKRSIESASKNAEGYANLTRVLYLIAIYAAAVLYLMIFKVEIDLRRIPKAIEKNE